MELLRGHVGEIKVSTPATNATYEVAYGDDKVTPPANAVITAGVASMSIPYAAVANSGDIKATLSFMHQGENYTIEREARVVTPILELHEIKEIHPNATPSELLRIEAVTRHIINAFTGQEFTDYTGEVVVRGRMNAQVLLPLRLTSVRRINGVSGIRTNLNDYWIKFPAFGVPPVKADFHGLHMHTGGVIHNPNNVRLDGVYMYTIDGTWGWKSVPDKVREAAKLLINDYACADIAYRDRYLTSMTAADWRIQYHEGAFQETGNVRADQLLRPFRVPTVMAVI